MKPMGEGAKRVAVQTSNVQGKGPSEGWSALSLGIARVTQMFAEDLRCSLEVVVGENGRPTYTGVELLMASAGSRHILGALPQVGDYCVVGWFANTLSKAGRKNPAIISWMPRTPYLGHDWLTVQDFAPEEGVLESSKSRQEVEYSANRIRFKLRHYAEGNVFASSAQGSDLVLDEGVLLSNRRANEIRLRDQDQAIVMRSLQQFHAMSGARVYGGMVQRVARVVPREVTSDGRDWAAGHQLDELGFVLQDKDLPRTDDANKLLPHKIFLRGSAESESFKADGGVLSDYLNPYFFYEEMGLVGEDGGVLGSVGSDVYGGKSILRVGSAGEAVRTSALSEYRVEVSHTTDGTLPVTEETDGFDCDKAEGTLPLVEFVLGSVVGNDPYTGAGSDLYGLPLGPRVSGDRIVLVPQLDEVIDQSATLVQVNPLVPNQAPTFTTITKGGAFYAGVGSNAAVNIEGALEVKGGSVGVGSAAEMELLSGGGISISANGGAVSIKGEGYSDLSAGSSDARLAQKSVIIEGRRGVSIQSGTAVVFNAPVVDFSNVKTMRFGASEGLVLKGGSGISVQTSAMKENINGSRETVVSGPVDGNPLNAQGVSETIACSPATGSVGGVVKKETVVAGDVEQTTLTIGNRTTTANLGNIRHIVRVGEYSAEAGTNLFRLSATSGAAVTTSVGDIALTAVTGGVTIVGTTGVTVRSVGPVTISGSVVNLGGAGVAAGPIMCGSDIDPIIGLPYSALGILPRAQNLVVI